MRSEVIVRARRRGQSRAWLVCAFLCTFGSSSVRAQLAEPIQGRALPQGRARSSGAAAQQESASAAKPERYRSGRLWIEVERVQASTAGAGLQPVMVRAGDRSFPAHIDGHAIIQLREGASLRQVLQRERLLLSQPLSAAARVYRVTSSHAEDGLAIASRLAAAEGVQEAEPDLYMPRVRHSISVPPNDPLYDGQWYLEKIAIEQAWKLSTGDGDTSVVVIDDGCDMQHPDLRKNLKGGFDAIDQDDDPSYVPGQKNNAHGTQCAGLIAAEADNGEGIAGVCPECGLYCVRLLPGEDRLVPDSADIAAFDFARQVGAGVVSNSWGFPVSRPAPAALRAVLEDLYDNGREGLGTLVVFAAGNENREIRRDEIAAVRGVLAIGAINNFDEAAPFSNYGDSVGLTAPAGTFTTDISGPEGMSDDDYTDSFGGTSSACPVVAGVAGLIISASKEMTAREVGALLTQTTREAPFAEPDSSGHDPMYGFGIVDPGAALRKALGLPEPDLDAAGSADAGESAKKGADPDAGGCAVVSLRGGAGSFGEAWLWIGVAVGLIARRRDLIRPSRRSGWATLMDGDVRRSRVGRDRTDRDSGSVV